MRGNNPDPALRGGRLSATACGPEVMSAEPINHLKNETAARCTERLLQFENANLAKG
jgi:hypothetical protein